MQSGRNFRGRLWLKKCCFANDDDHNHYDHGGRGGGVVTSRLNYTIFQVIKIIN
jgi:hypothetical protein